LSLNVFEHKSARATSKKAVEKPCYSELEMATNVREAECFDPKQGPAK